MGYAKVIHKKERKRKRKKGKKDEKKMDKCPRYLKQWVLRRLPKERRDE
jgi:hypothetical protein